MAMQAASDATDLEAVRRWFARLADCVRAVDYAAAFPLFAEDLVAFGTYDDFVTGREQVMEAQWTKVWPTIREFRWRLDEVTALVSPDRLAAAGLAIFESDGFRRDGSRFDRCGRATVVLALHIAQSPRHWWRLGWVFGAPAILFTVDLVYFLGGLDSAARGHMMAS